MTLCTALIILLMHGLNSSVPDVLAHSGRTNADDCHNNRKIGAYHCHREPLYEIKGLPSVIDGDTLNISGELIRLAGIDAPEKDQNCKHSNGVSWPCGEEATAALKALVSGKKVRCYFSDRDLYGRLEATCYVGSKNIAAELVKMGLALDDPDNEPSYNKMESRARSAGQGMHCGEFLEPWEWRKAK